MGEMYLEITDRLSTQLKNDEEFQKIAAIVTAYHKLDTLNDGIRHIFIWKDLHCNDMHSMKYVIIRLNTELFRLVMRFDDTDFTKYGYLDRCHYESAIIYNKHKKFREDD